LARELTKAHQEIVRGTLETIIAAARSRRLRGEMTLVVAGAREAEPDRDAAVKLARELMAEGLPATRAAAIAARTFKVTKRGVYGRL
jgi:16S rRNA (cytidine1402-2'-O)-methyltransferase